MRTKAHSSVTSFPEPGIDGKPGVSMKASEHDHLDDQSFKAQLTSLIPHLRAFARSLCLDPILAEDLAQDAMLRAWQARGSFKQGSNMKAWTFTILRNVFYSEKRRSWRRLPLDPEVAESSLLATDDPSSSMDLLAVRNGISMLPDEQREALILVGAGGLAYNTVAEICGCAIGTVKSRVSRARRALVAVLAKDGNGFTFIDDLRAGDAFEDLMEQVSILKNPAPSNRSAYMAAD